jgi:hypothetical protein
MSPIRILAPAALFAALVIPASAQAQIVEDQFWCPGGSVSAGLYLVRAKSGEREMSAKVLRLE